MKATCKTYRLKGKFKHQDKKVKQVHKTLHKRLSNPYLINQVKLLIHTLYLRGNTNAYQHHLSGGFGSVDYRALEDANDKQL